MEKEVKCPSGMTGVIRALKVEDEKLYTNPQLIKSQRLFVEWCKRCWLKTINPGPYRFADGVIDWDYILLGDVFYLFFELVKMKIGKYYEFDFTCPECRTRINRSVDLEEELFVKDLHDNVRQAFAAGQLLTTEIPGDGRTVMFRLLLAGDQQMISQLETNRGMPTTKAAMTVRLQAVDGVKFDSFWDKPAFIEGLDSGVADELEDIFESMDCGIDTDVEIACTDAIKCGWEDVIQLPLRPNLFRKTKRNLKELRDRKAKRAELRKTKSTLNTNPS
jgi:hypothetical protein